MFSALDDIRGSIKGQSPSIFDDPHNGSKFQNSNGIAVTFSFNRRLKTLEIMYPLILAPYGPFPTEIELNQVVSASSNTMLGANNCD
jgi:hypothetical protein